MTEAAVVLVHRVKRKSALKCWGMELLDRKGAGKTHVAVARKLTVLLWTLWKSGESFQPWPRAAAA